MGAKNKTSPKDVHYRIERNLTIAAFFLSVSAFNLIVLLAMKIARACGAF